MFQLTRQHEFLVGVDSDGCAFDTMEVKHKECFIPNTVNHWDLQAVSKYARQAGELGNPALEKAVGGTGDPVLARTLEWSRAVNRSVEEIVRGVPPFPFVRESL